MQSFTRWLVVAAGMTLTVSALAAGDPNEKAIKSRKAVMTLQSWYAGPLFAMAKGDMEYDADMAKANAAALNTMAIIKGDLMWPPGTDNGAYAGETRALPAIWSTWPEVGNRARALSDATGALSVVAGDGLGALRSKIGAVGKACKGCHDDFRAE